MFDVYATYGHLPFNLNIICYLKYFSNFWHDLNKLVNGSYPPKVNTVLLCFMCLTLRISNDSIKNLKWTWSGLDAAWEQMHNADRYAFKSIH